MKDAWLHAAGLHFTTWCRRAISEKNRTKMLWVCCFFTTFYYLFLTSLQKWNQTPTPSAFGCRYAVLCFHGVPDDNMISRGSKLFICWAAPIGKFLKLTGWDVMRQSPRPPSIYIPLHSISDTWVEIASSLGDTHAVRALRTIDVASSLQNYGEKCLNWIILQLYIILYYHL